MLFCHPNTISHSPQKVKKNFRKNDFRKYVLDHRKSQNVFFYAKNSLWLFQQPTLMPWTKISTKDVKTFSSSQVAWWLRGLDPSWWTVQFESPDPVPWKITPGMHKILRGEWGRRDWGVVITPGGCFLTFCLWQSPCTP